MALFLTITGHVFFGCRFFQHGGKTKDAANKTTDTKDPVTIESNASSPEDIAAWFDSELPDDTYVGVLYEIRCDTENDDPTKPGTVLTREECKGRTDAGWFSPTNTLQPFKSKTKLDANFAMWRKDFVQHNFYGEVFTFDDQYLYLVSESFPCFPNACYSELSEADCKKVGEYDPGTHNCWIFDPGRFRLFVLAEQGYLTWPYSLGRVLAPRKVDFSWTLRSHFHSYLCSSWDDFENGKCGLPQKQECGVTQKESYEVPYQSDFYDQVSLTKPPINNGVYSTAFDGANEAPGPSGEKWSLDAELQTLTDGVVIEQVQEGTEQVKNLGRERFFLARRGQTMFGMVRWDSSVYSEKLGGWFVNQRTIGYHLVEDSNLGFSQMEERAKHHIVQQTAVLRILQTPEMHDLGTRQTCPIGMESIGQMSVGNPKKGASHVYDVSGFNVHGVAEISFCVDTKRAPETRLIADTTCPPEFRRGSFYVDSAWVYDSLDSPLAAANNIQEGWVTLCSSSDSFLFRSSGVGAPPPCASDEKQTGAVFRYVDCYDGTGVRCVEGSKDWMALCSK